MYRLFGFIVCSVLCTSCTSTVPSGAGSASSAVGVVSTSTTSAFVTSTSATVGQTHSLRFRNCRQFSTMYNEPNAVTTAPIFGRTFSVPFNASWPFLAVETIGTQAYFGTKRPSTPEDDCAMYRDFVAIQTAARSAADAIMGYAAALQIPEQSIKMATKDSITYIWLQAKTADCTAPIAEIIGTDANIVITMPCSAALFYNEPMLQFLSVVESVR